MSEEKEAGYRESVDWNDSEVKTSNYADFKIQRFKVVPDTISQITLEPRGPERRHRHYARRYELYEKGDPSSLDEKDIKAGLCVLPHPDTGEDAVYRPATSKPTWVYARCLSHTGFCPVCADEKTSLSKKDKRRIQKSSESFLANIFVWKTDKHGNLLGKSTGKPIDCLGQFILLEADGTWDQVTYEHDYEEEGNSYPKDEPTGEVSFYIFGADKFVQIRQGMRLNRKRGPLEKMNFTIEADGDGSFQKAKLTPLIHDDSAANHHFPMVEEQFKAKALKNRGTWIAKEHSHKDLVYLFGLDAKHLPKSEDFEVGGSHADPPTEEGEEKPEVPKEEVEKKEEALTADLDDSSEGKEDDFVPAESVGNVLDGLDEL